MLPLIYTSDLHGDPEIYRAAGGAALRTSARAVVLGGDLCPGTPSASSINLPRSQPEFLLNEVGPMVEGWKRAHPALRVLAIPGNDDCQTILAALSELEQRGLVENLHQRALRMDSHTLVGLSFVPPTPFSIKDFERRDLKADSAREPQIARSVVGTADGFREVQDFDAYLKALPSIEEELEALPLHDPSRTIAVIHCPPFQTRCDALFSGQPIGSRALRRWIELHQPLLTLHGHIHESPKMSGAFFDRIGRTLVVNPGASARTPHLVHIDLENLSILEHSVYGRRET
jgi:Icc-related predicted phosphoesterase